MKPLKIALLLLFCLAAWQLPAEAAAGAFRVYLVFSYSPGMWDEQGRRGVELALRNQNITDFETKVYNYNYVEKRKYRTEELRKITAEIAGFRPDLIIVFDDEASEDLIPDLNRLDIPIVATGINRELKDLSWFKPEGAADRNFTGVLERYPFEQPLKFLKKINPEISEITILTSENVSSSVIVEQFIRQFRKSGGASSGIRLKEVIKSRDWERWQAAIRSHRGVNEAFWILVPWDVYGKDGKEVPLNEIGEFYQRESRIPELGIVNANHMIGLLACFSVNSEDLGYQAAAAGIQAIKNKRSLSRVPFAKVETVRLIINKKRADTLHYKIPIGFLEFAEIEKKIPLSYLR